VDMTGIGPVTPACKERESCLIAPCTILVSIVFNNLGNLLSLKANSNVMKTDKFVHCSNTFGI
jgi:hypothetical protein